MKALCALLALFGLLPVLHAADMSIAPPWEIVVVDRAGKPVSGAHVLQLWGCNFREEYVGDKANAVTDKDGRVRFPARSITPPSTTVWKKARNRIDGKGMPDPTASLYISLAGHQPVWIHSRRDPRVHASREGLTTRVVLEPETPR